MKPNRAARSAKRCGPPSGEAGSSRSLGVRSPGDDSVTAEASRLCPPKEETMSLTRVQFFSISLDGFGTGEGQSLETPFGHAGERLHEWMFRTRWWHTLVGEPGGSAGIDDALVLLHDPGVGAEIMGSRKFGPTDWPERADWKGWSGEESPFQSAGLVP